MAQGVPDRLRPPIILTFQHYKGGRSSARINPWYSLSEAESTSGHMVLSGVPRKKSPIAPPGIEPGTIRLVAQRLNHYATPGPSRIMMSGLLLRIVLSVRTCWFHNMVTLPSLLVSADFVTWSYQCSFIIIIIIIII